MPQDRLRSRRHQLRLLTCLPVFSTRLVRESILTYSERPVIKKPEDAALLLASYFEDKDREEMLALLLDAGKTVIGLARLSVGARSQTLLDPAALFKAAILANADALVLAHNHPSGNCEPSTADVQMTKTVVAAGELMGIPVLDHLILGDGYVSLAERGLL